ncbi:alpha/beta hydrolase [Paraglaciecola marina]|uniref:alpha/beta hydrolase n=1 Tax=Paraglaciecola marina TaxID=2500157 RepID=UPI001EF1023F|nr:alpha/beta hydrolase-fold protein [Paraglaciecola marina]
MNVFLLLLFSLVSMAVAAVDVEVTNGIFSEVLNEKTKITVKLPLSYTNNKNKTYPVFYVLDDGINTELVDSMNRHLHSSNGANEHIVIGVNTTNRLRDFAPRVNMDPRGPVGEGGGADRFLDYIETELMPHINKAYRTNNHNVVAGHSIAGLFVVHAFHSRPNLFQAHLAFSPAVWWGAREAATAAQQSVIKGVSVGSFLYFNIGTESGEMREVYDNLTQTILRNRSSDLILYLDVFDNESHDFTMAAGLYNALKGLYKYQQDKGM